MPDPHRIKGELLTLLSRPQYASLFHHRNQFRGPKDPAATPENVAEQTANHIWKANAHGRDPVEVVEREGPGRTLPRCMTAARECYPRAR